MLEAKRYSRTIGILLLAVGAGAWQGCGTDSIPTAPDETSDDPTFVVSGESSPQTSSPDPGDWYEVASVKIKPGKETVVSGSRYTLTIPKQSVQSPITVSISEWHSRIVDIKFEPAGTVFSKPAILEIDYSLTPNDPNMPYYNWETPSVSLYDETTETWQVLMGNDDPVALVYTVTLDHFSRYAMPDGVSGWVPWAYGEHRPHTEGFQEF